MPLVMPAGRADLQKMDGRIYQALEKQAHYLLGLVHPWDRDPQLLLVTDSRSDEHHIRPNTGVVAGLCFLHRFGPYEDGVVGVSRADLLGKTIVPMMRYLVATHVTGERATGDGKQWGDAWQSAHWAQMLGCGVWWVWDDLPADLRIAVRRVVAHEADRIAREKVPYQIKLDTKAEENAWNSRVLSIAVLLMPGDPRRAEWETAFRKWAFSSFLRPADAHSQPLVDGRTVASQFGGANIYDDFTLENHNIVHPDYMTCFSLSLSAGLDYVTSGRTPPECLLYNAGGIYENLKWFVLPDGGFVYPNGQDWQLFRNADWVGSHLLMAVFARDGDAWELANRSLDTLEKMQRRHASGAIYAPGESFFASTQSDRLVSLAGAWLTLKCADRIPRAFHEPLGVRRLDCGKIILHRTPAAIHTFSWGAAVMAQCVPLQLDRIVSPDSRNGIGHVTLKGAAKPLPVHIHRVEVTQGDDWFAADLTLDHGKDQIRAELQFRSNADGTWIAREKLVALSDVTTAEVATGLIGVLNDPGWVYEKGRREIVLDGRKEVIPALSGKTVAGAAREITVDSALRIHSERPLQFRYAGAKTPERSRATDALALNYLGGDRSWRKGDVISEYQATIRTGIKP